MTTRSYDIDELVAGVVANDRRLVARTLRCIDDEPTLGREIAAQLHDHRGGAHVIGLTGNPGAGKSTLVDHLLEQLRQQGKRVAVFAVDPSSPFSGGAILGDRVRMSRHFTDDGVFIRSLATRGALGGLSRATFGSTRVLDAAGFDVILVETVGVGQDEVDVVRLADTTVVVLVPGLGDDIQAIKAGLLEIADVFVVNKADRDGADEVERGLQQMLTLDPEPPPWAPPILRSVASRGEGIAALLEVLEQHREFSAQPAGQKKHGERQRALFDRLLDASLIERGRASLGDAILEATGRVTAEGEDPYLAVKRLVGSMSG